MPSMPPDHPDPDTSEILATPLELDVLEPEIEPTPGENLELLMDVQLPVSVELGRSRMQVKEVLEIQRGSVITLDKMAGEPSNLLVNGKVLATGEIVVIDDNFGIRITKLVGRMDRLETARS